MKKKVDSRIRTLVENGVKTRQRSLFVIVGDKGRDQVWFLCSSFILGGFPTSVCWNQMIALCMPLFFMHFYAFCMHPFSMYFYAFCMHLFFMYLYALPCEENDCVLVDCKWHSRSNQISDRDL